MDDDNESAHTKDFERDTTMTTKPTIYERWDEFMYQLSAQPRRQIITSLMEAPDLAWLPLPEAAVTPDLDIDLERLELKLRQIHLPTMTKAGYVGWTKEPFRVNRGPRFDEPAAVMEVLLSADNELPPALVSGCVSETA